MYCKSVWAASCEKVPKDLSTSTTEYGVHPSFGMTPTFSMTSTFRKKSKKSVSYHQKNDGNVVHSPILLLV